MPAGMHAIRTALVERIGSIPDFTAYPFIPDTVNAPGAFVEPDRPFVDYQQVFQTGEMEWKFMVTVLVNRLDEPSAQDELDSYLDPMGPFVTTLQSMDAQDTLYNLVSYVNVMSATRYGAYTIGGTTYLGAQLLITVRG